jgi:SOS-response transcriptional repressor LexA
MIGQSNLPRRQKAVYEFILRYKEKHGYEPSTLVIAKHAKVTVQSIQFVMKALIKKGYIEPREYEPRGQYSVIHRYNALAD